ncbi:3-oxoacyl-synth [Choiromyces venosus 120613-1]|uniref:3-oxoacyl-[acyl-carrier-protein] synthase n=1 Tax=Choiromyces venosus 120613-1 TaxID=1336337 RepID=A0A3N4JV34_9PEZI|nr:3-oxoacyl-synth [Choiromyces venosus 120613-1]
MRRVVVTGMGAVTPLAVGAAKSWQRLIEGHCGIKSIQNRPEFAGIPSQVAATIPPGTSANGGWDPNEWLAQGDARRMALFTQYAIAAAEEALNDAGWKPTSQGELERTGVCIGSGIGSLEDMYDFSKSLLEGGVRKLSALFVPRLLINLAAGHITMKHGFQGPNHAVSTACATGAHSIGDASRFIHFGDADIMLAGGSEACIHPLSLAGFSRLKSLSTSHNSSPTRSSRPFDRDRSGFVMGEGAGVLVLEELEHARARGASIYAELRGYGLSSDAHHITTPPKSGGGAYLAMKRALQHAGVRPKEVGYINAHATSTSLGDAAENNAIKRLMLGDGGLDKAGQVTVSSSKGAVGHLLGAAGAVEAIFAVRALKEGLLPPTLNLENTTHEFDCNYVPLKAQSKDVDTVLSNSFGFGGTNASLCFSKIT